MMCLNDPQGIKGATQNAAFKVGVLHVPGSPLGFPVLFATWDINPGQPLYLDYGGNSAGLRQKLLAEGALAPIMDRLHGEPLQQLVA